jgi:hypothetical protein
MLIRIAIVSFAIAACGGGSESKPPDAFVPMADAFESTCGQPGDTGNEQGIGKFCTSFGDCADTPNAPLCSIIGDSTTHFCTKTCQSTDPPDVCGTATQCVCNNNNQCGCTPTSCL